MRTKSIVLLLLALGCGLVASIGISQIIEQNKQGGGPQEETEAILVAMKAIVGQDQLKAENVKLEQWPKKLIPKGALTRLDQIEGRRAKFSMAPGEPIMENKLVGDEDRRATVDVPPGYRLVAVPADAVNAVGHLIQPGDRVDILVYLKNNFRGGAQDAGAVTFLQDIKVFAVNDQWRPSEEKGSDPIAVKNVTLLVTPEQAEKVTLATELGKLKLVLRSPDDNQRAELVHGTTPTDLLGGGSDKANRDHEYKFIEDNATAGKPRGRGLLGMLGFGKSDEPNEPFDIASVGPTAPHEHFTMQLIEGSQTRTVEFVRANSQANTWQQGGGSSPAPAGSGASDSDTTSLLPFGNANDQDVTVNNDLTKAGTKN